MWECFRFNIKKNGGLKHRTYRKNADSYTETGYFLTNLILVDSGEASVTTTRDNATNFSFSFEVFLALVKSKIICQDFPSDHNSLWSFAPVPTASICNAVSKLWGKSAVEKKTFV